MPNYVLPTFNLGVNIWRNGNGPPAAPDVQTLGNLSPGELTGLVPVSGSADLPLAGGMWLRLPAATDIRDFKDAVGPDNVEVPAGSGRTYDVVWVDDIGGGFANEHRFAALAGTSPWPSPFPSPGGFSPPAGGIPLAMQIYGTTATWFPAQFQGIGVPEAIFPSDYAYVVVMHHTVSGPGPVFTIGGVAQTPSLVQALVPYLGWSPVLSIFVTATGLGPSGLLIDFGAGNTGMAIGHAYRVLGAGGTLGPVASNATLAVQPPVLALPGGITSSDNAVLAVVAAMCSSPPTLYTPFAAPFANAALRDGAPAAPGYAQICSGFALNPAVGPLTLSANPGNAGDSVATAILSTF